MSKEDIECIEKYKTAGEGRLTSEQISSLKKFDIKHNVPTFKISDYPEEPIISHKDSHTINQHSKTSKQPITSVKKSTSSNKPKKTKKHNSAGGRKTRKQKSGFMSFLNKYTRKHN